MSLESSKVDYTKHLSQLATDHPESVFASRFALLEERNRTGHLVKETLCTAICGALVLALIAAITIVCFAGMDKAVLVNATHLIGCNFELFIIFTPSAIGVGSGLLIGGANILYEIFKGRPDRLKEMNAPPSQALIDQRQTSENKEF